MGAYEFTAYGFGKTADAAFDQCVQDAQWEHGHGGYTGTIAEKGSFRMLPTPKTRLPLDDLAYCAINNQEAVSVFRPFKEGDDPKLVSGGRWDRKKGAMVQYIAERKQLPPKIREWVQRAHRVVSDKWGPAGCIEITGKAAKEYRERRGLKGKRGKVFLFFGLASS